MEFPSENKTLKDVQQLLKLFTLY